jgi:type II secretory pathway component PulM
MAFAGKISMISRLLLLTVTAVVLLVGAFVLLRTPPTETVAAASSVQAPVPERRAESVSVMTEMVTAQTITSARAASVATHPIVRNRPASAQKRSLLARVLLGNGDSRPEPFPRPARGVSGKP